MQSRSVSIGFQGLQAQQTKSYIGFERYEDECDNNNIPVNYPSGNTSLPLQTNNILYSDHPSSTSKTMPHSSHLSKQDINSHFPVQRLFSPLISAIYTEIVTRWFNEDWLIFVNNHKETFLTLNSDITGFLTAQMAIDQHCFTINRLSLQYQPECLLVRTEKNNKSLFLPNSIISLKHLFDKKKKNCQGKLIAILCQSNELNSQLMFYKDSLRNHWYIFSYDEIKASQSFSNILSNEQQLNLESILQENNQTNFIHPSKLSFPLSALFTHPVIYVYLVQRRNDENK